MYPAVYIGIQPVFVSFSLRASNLDIYTKRQKTYYRITTT